MKLLMPSLLGLAAYAAGTLLGILAHVKVISTIVFSLIAMLFVFIYAYNRYNPETPAPKN